MSSERAFYRNSPPSSAWEIETLKELGFKKGMILRVKMVNFLTYDDCEVYPGPKLNVILGPNGTGKSTIMHAVCLACAGSPATVGRSPDLRQFVKQGKEDKETYIEIDLMSDGVKGHGKTVRVKRAISAETKAK